MIDTPLTPEQQDIVLAGELVLRLLPPEEERQARQRAANDPVFASLVSDWEQHFASIAEEIEGVEPRQALREALLEKVAPQLAVKRRSIWPWVAALALVIAVVLLTIKLWLPALAAPDASAPLTARDGTSFGTAEIYTKHNTLTLRLPEGPPPTGQVYQVWDVTDRRDPVSLGIIPARGLHHFQLQSEALGQITALSLSVTLEPQGGSRSGRPTGRSVATATLTTQ